MQLCLSFWSFAEKTFVKQSLMLVVQNFTQISPLYLSPLRGGGGGKVD